MKIAFTGASGTGKTVLAKKVAEEYNLHYIEEGVREYMTKNNITHLRDLSPHESLEMQKWLVDYKVINESIYADDFVTCRTYADNIAYALKWIGREKDLQDEVEKYVFTCLRNLNDPVLKYDYVFLCPHGVFPIEEDGTRSVLKMYQMEIDCLIHGIYSIDWTDVKPQILFCEDIEGRLQEIRRTITNQYTYERVNKLKDLR